MGISLYDLFMLFLKAIQLYVLSTQLECSLVTDMLISNTHTEWSLWGVGVMVRAVGGSRSVAYPEFFFGEGFNKFS